MDWLQKQIAKLLIPRGYYCDGCPFWFKNGRKPRWVNGYCSYLSKGDWDFDAEEVETFLWDKCKVCGVRKR